MAIDPNLNLGGATQVAYEADYAKLLESFPYRPTLFLGVGGTGCRAVNSIKQLFLRLVGPQARANQPADVPDIDQMYSFLAFDTNSGETPSDLTPLREWFHLGVSDLGAFYSGIGKDAFFRDWLVRDYPATQITAGCSGFRGLGRLALMANIHLVHKQISDKRASIQAAAARPHTVNPKPLVVLFGSVSGGTGAGMLLDVCFLLRGSFGQDAEIVGLVAVLDGLPSLPETSKQQVRTNTFAALKELNAYMTGDGLPRGWRKLITYPLDVPGYVMEPMSECYLVTPYRSDGTKNLAGRDHIPSFMARYAFMMTAYSFETSRTPDYGGVMVDHRRRLLERHRGVTTSFCVPAIAQAHFPVESMFAVLTLEAAAAFLRHLGGGERDEGETTASRFRDNHGLSFQSLLEFAKTDPQSKDGAVLGPASYDETVASLLEDKERYQKPEEVLGYGERMTADRLKELEHRLGANADRAFATLWPEIEAEEHKLLADEATRGPGALDFVEDLKHVLERERDILTEEARRRFDPVWAEVERQWAQIRGVVEDVVTDDGLADRFWDRFKVDKAKAIFVTFLNEAEMAALEKARCNVALTLASKLIAALDDEIAKLRQFLEHDRTAAIRLLAQKARAIHTSLHQETEGTESSVENICSVSVMNEQWRQAYWREHKLSSAPALAADLRTRGLHPAALMKLRPMAGERIEACIAQAVVDSIEPLFLEVKRMRPVDVLAPSAGLGPGEERLTEEARADRTTRAAAEAIAQQYFQMLKPQAQVNLMAPTVGVAPDTLVFCGGVDAALEERLKATGHFEEGRLASAQNQERNRLSFFANTLPVALAGCDLVANVLEPAYAAWAARTEKEKDRERKLNEQRLYHTMPGSFDWPSPTRVEQEDSDERALFGRALAVAEMLDLTDADRARMTKVVTSRDFGYGLYRVGRSQFWLWPFFEPQNPDATIEGVPLKLGTNVLTAFQTLLDDEALRGHALRWVEWLGDSWNRFYKANEVADRRRKAVAAFEAAKGKVAAKEKEQIALWDAMIRAVQEWEIG